MRSVRYWGALCVTLCAITAMFLVGWSGRGLGGRLEWRDGRSVFVDGVHGTVLVVDPLAAKVVATIPVPGIETVTELSDVWMAETDLASRAPRRLVSIDKSTHEVIAQSSLSKAGELLAADRTAWLIGSDQRAHRVDPRSLQLVGDPVRLPTDTDVNTAVIREDGTLAVLDGSHLRVILIQPDGHRINAQLQSRAGRLMSSRTRFWVTLPERDTIGTVTATGVTELPAGFDLSDDAVLTAERNDDLIAVRQPELPRGTRTDSTYASARTRIALGVC